MDNILKFSFFVKNYQILTSKQLQESDWLLSLPEFFSILQSRPETLPKLDFLPPMKRRRLSRQSRLFFEAAWSLVTEQPNIPVVYASLNGEINRSFELWRSLILEGDVSPTSFSLSVHNALIGQWSELRKVTAEMTAISAQKDCLETALLEAFLLLQDGQDQVLVAVCESFLDKKFAVAAPRLTLDYALCLVVEKGEGFELSLFDTPEDAGIDNALSWMRNMQVGSKRWKTPASNGGHWQWVKA